MNIIEIGSDSEFYQEALKLRYKVFFKEHNLSQDILLGEHEIVSRHIAMVANGILIAYGRLTEMNAGMYQISQLVVVPGEQGKGCGSMILKQLIALACGEGAERIVLNARVTATALYRKQGFKSAGSEFLSKTTAVPHIKMIYTTAD